MLKIVNIHIPKCGGTSFKKSLSNNYVNMIDDYDNNISRDLNLLIKSFNIFNEKIDLNDYKNIDCISGHILPVKYEKLYEYNWKFITWLREPSQRLYSTYYHHKRHNSNKHLGKYINDNNLTIEEFVLDKKIKNFYQRFFHNFPIKNYFFIGIFENYEKDLKYLSNLLNIELKIYYVNENPNKKNKEYLINSDLLEKIKEFHNEDYKLYNSLLKKSNLRI